MRRADRRSHLYAIGKTGTGKSTMLERLIRQDLERGEGVALLDTHGDLAERLLDCIPPWRANELCYFDPSDLAQTSGFDPRTIMDRRGIFIANLSKGKIGEDSANLIGSLLVSNFALAVVARADTPEHHRADFYLYVDEFQNFATDSFASILSEARKYRLSLSLFHQYIDQLSDPLRRAVFGNVGTTVAFRVGQTDAVHLANEFEHQFAPERFT